MLKVLTRREVEASNRKVNEWWESLGWDIKHKLQGLVWTVQHPVDQSLPMYYADDADNTLSGTFPY